MRILLINKYNYIRGGAEKVFIESQKLLHEAGHEVVLFCMEHPQNEHSAYTKYFAANSDTDGIGLGAGFKAFARAIYSTEAARKLNALIDETKPDIAHIHFYDQLSSTILRVLKKRNVPVVLTAHDYKLVCPHYYLNKDGVECPKNIWAHFWQTIFKKRHRNSYLASIGVAVPWLINKFFKVYEKNIDMVVTPAEYAAKKMAEYGWPADKIKVLRNFVGNREETMEHAREFVLFAGRLSYEKGIHILFEVAKLLPEIKFVVAGTGDTELPVLPNVDYVGYKNQEHLNELYKKAKVFFFPSIWDEVCPMVLLEAGMHQVPVVASGVGGVAEIVEDGRTGLLFDPRSAEASQKAVGLIKELTQNPIKSAEMGKRARGKILTDFNKSGHLNELLKLYTSLISSKISHL